MQIMDCLENRKTHSKTSGNRLNAPKPIVVVGAGWAGLACAFTLVRAGLPVILLEAAPQAGGRARGIPWGTDTVDNGQHLLLGAYTQTLALLKQLSIPEEQVLDRRPFELRMIDLKKPQSPLYLHLKNTSPWQALRSLLAARGLGVADKLRVFLFLRKLPGLHASDFRNQSTHDFLIASKQSTRLVEDFWGPLALAALSTPITHSAAEIFVSVLQRSFAQGAGFSDCLVPKTDLSDFLVKPLLAYLAKTKTPVFYHQRVLGLDLQQGHRIAVHTPSKRLACQALVLATPPSVSLELLKSLSMHGLTPLIQALGRFRYERICTVYLRFRTPIDLGFEGPLLGLLNASADWLFQRATCAQPDLLSVIITGAKALALERSVLLATLQAELKSLFPSLGDPSEVRMIYEKQAAFSCTPDSYQYRPFHQTRIPNLYLAGDYTQSPYPATLEGAVQSGIQAAELLLSKHEHFTRAYTDQCTNTARLEPYLGL